MQVPSPKELDAQSSVHIDEWVDVGSDKFREIVGDLGVFKYFIRWGFHDPPFLFTDSMGRVWGHFNNRWFPFHDVVRGRAYGYRYATKAAN